MTVGLLKLMGWLNRSNDAQSPMSVVLTDRKRTAQILRAKTLKKKFEFFFSVNFTQILGICPKMLQFLIYLLHKQIIEMRRSQNLRYPFLVPSRRPCLLRKPEL